MFYLMTHSTHFIYGYMASVLRNEEKYLFNDTFSTLYGVEHMVKNHSDNKRKPVAAITWTTFFY